MDLQSSLIGCALKRAMNLCRIAEGAGLKLDDVTVGDQT